MSVASWSGALLDWHNELAALKKRVAPVCARAEVRATAGAFIDGLLSATARKTGWQRAEQAGLAKPDRMQSLLCLILSAAVVGLGRFSLMVASPSGPRQDEMHIRHRPP